MKTRNGFVSNSSSSSFIIAVKKSETCKHCGRSDPDFIALLHIKSDYGDSDQTEVKSTNIVQIVKELKEWGYPDSDRSELIKKILAYKDNPKFQVARIQISYHDDIFNAMYNEGVKLGKIIELDRCE